MHFSFIVGVKQQYNGNIVLSYYFPQYFHFLNEREFLLNIFNYAVQWLFGNHLLFFSIGEKTHECLNLKSVTIINIFLSFNTLILFFFYWHKKKSAKVPKDFGGQRWAWVGDGTLAGLLRHVPSPALEELGPLAGLTSMSTALPERHTSPDDLSTSTYLLDLYHD